MSTTHGCHKQSFLFVQGSGSNRRREKAERRLISSHVMKNFVARAKDNHKDHTKEPRKPVPCIIQFSLPKISCQQQREYQLPCTVAANSFDPFDSLATDNQRNTVSILRSLFQPVQLDVAYFSWTTRHFDVLGRNYWDTAMSDITAYHVVGTMQLVVRQDKDFYFHKTQAYRHLRQSVAHCTKTRDAKTKSTILSIANLLYLTGHELNLEESIHHVQAMNELLTRNINDDFNPMTWFTVHFGPLNFCTAFPFAHPFLPYYAHPACEWQDVIDDNWTMKSKIQANKVLRALPVAVNGQTLHSLFGRLLDLAPLTIQARHYEAIMGLYLNLKYDLCVCLGEVYWSLASPPAAMHDYHNSESHAPFSSMRPEVAFFQKVYGSLGKRRFGRLTGEAAKANYMLLIALHLSLWMLCTNRTRIQANAGASRLIDTVAEF